MARRSAGCCAGRPQLWRRFTTRFLRERPRHSGAIDSRQARRYGRSHHAHCRRQSRRRSHQFRIGAAPATRHYTARALKMKSRSALQSTTNWRIPRRIRFRLPFAAIRRARRS